MGVCNNCGNQISDGQLTCPVCGAYTGAGAQANNQAPQQNMYNHRVCIIRHHSRTCTTSRVCIIRLTAEHV